MKKEKYRFYSSLFLGYGYTFILFLGIFGILLEYLILPKSFADEELSTIIIWNVMFGFLPLILWILLIHRGFTLIEFSEKGINMSLFRFFRKKFMAWDEIIDVKISYRLGPWLFLSKIKLNGMTYEKMVTNKNIVQIALNDEVLKAYNKYSGKTL